MTYPTCSDQVRPKSALLFAGLAPSRTRPICRHGRGRPRVQAVRAPRCVRGHGSSLCLIRCAGCPACPCRSASCRRACRAAAQLSLLLPDWLVQVWGMCGRIRRHWWLVCERALSTWSSMISRRRRSPLLCSAASLWLLLTLGSVSWSPCLVFSLVGARPGCTRATQQQQRAQTAAASTRQNTGSVGLPALPAGGKKKRLAAQEPRGTHTKWGSWVSCLQLGGAVLFSTIV